MTLRQPERTSPGYYALLRSLVIMALSGATVYALFAWDVVDTARIKSAYQEHAVALLLDVLCLLGVAALTTVRHKSLLDALIPVSWRRAAAANVISQAVGQWAPGSTVVAEVLRIGLLLGNTAKAERRPDQVSRITIGSVVDRLIGLGVFFWAGAIAAALAAVSGHGAHAGKLWFIFAASLLLGSALVSAAFAGDVALMASLIRWLQQSTSGRVGRLFQRLAEALESIRTASRCYRTSKALIVRAIALTFGVNLLFPLTYYLASVAVGEPIPFLLLAAVLPTTLLSVLLPIGFAGFGGPQLIIAGHFAMFGISAKTVFAVTLVQNTIALAVQTALGVAWAASYGSSAALILRRSAHR